MSPESVYVVVYDLTKDLLAEAHCMVNSGDNKEVEIPAPDFSDTNLDHIMRWMDLVHSLRHKKDGEVLPPVVLVGTHADCADSKMKETLENFLCHNSRIFTKRIARSLMIDNTLAGQLSTQGQEDPRIVHLRKAILNVSKKMPHTKVEIPLKWLKAEKRVYDLSKHGKKFSTKAEFKMDIVAHVDEEEEDEEKEEEIEETDVAHAGREMEYDDDDFEHLLNFLHDRGTIVYHDRADNPDGLIVLDPQWLIDVLCQIITVKVDKEEIPHILALRKDLQYTGILDKELFDHACENMRLDDIKDSLLFVMKKFNLLCECKDKDGRPVYLVPCMLTTKPPKDLMGPASQGSAPVFITFDTKYVPAGVFSRLLVLFGEWATPRTSCEQQQLFANAARFLIGEVTCLGFTCCKTVIKIHIWTMDNSNPVQREPEACSEVSR